MDTIRDGSTDGDGQAERPESSTERVTEDPASGATEPQAGDDRADPGVGGESREGGQQLEKKSYWYEWYHSKGGKEKVKASRKRRGQSAA